MTEPETIEDVPRTPRSILALAATLRLGLLAAALTLSSDATIFHCLDTNSYLGPAQNLLERGQFLDADGAAEIRRSPGFSIVLTPGLALGAVDLVTILIQIAMSIATVALVYHTTLLVTHSRRAGSVAAILYAVEPLSILHCCYLLTETTFALCIAAMTFYLVRYWRETKWSDAALAGAMLAAATFVRPISYYLPPVVAGAIALRFFFPSTRRGAVLAHAAVFSLLAIGPVAAWQARNYAETGYRGFSTISDVTWYYFQGASVAAKRNGTTFSEECRAFGFYSNDEAFRADPELRDLSPAEQYHAIGKRGKKLVFDHPMVYAPIHLKGIAHMLGSSGAHRFLPFFGASSGDASYRQEFIDHGFVAGVVALARDYPGVFFVSLVGGLTLLVYYGLTLASLLDWRTAISPSMATIFVLIAYFMAVSGGPVGSHRYRHPIMPLFCITAAAGFLAWRKRREQRRGGAVGANEREASLVSRRIAA